MRAARRAALGVALAIALAPLLWTWTPITADKLALAFMVGTAVAVLATGVVCRVLRLPDAAASLVQVVVLAGWLAWLASSFVALPRVPVLLAEGARRLMTTPLPQPASPGVTVLLCAVAGIVAVLADLLAITLERPAMVVAPLLTVLLVPALAPKVHTPPTWGTVVFAVGLALVLFVGRRRPEGGGIRGSSPAAASAALATALALVGALIVAPAIPVPPSMRGGDGEPIQMNDLSLDLKREISRGANTPAFDYSTDDGGPAYLRLYSLPTFNANGWRLTNSSVQMGRLTAPPGLDAGKRRRTSVTLTGFSSEWLPAPYAPLSTTAGDKWGYLPDSLSILALGVTNRKALTTTVGSYTVDSLDSRPTAEQLAAASAGTPPDADLTASVPSDISPELVRLAARITADATTSGQKAQAILNYLARPEFTYSLEAQPGSGYPGLEDFLLRDHKGFCIQYAASTAILARIAGIPSRMAIGFTPGTKKGDRYSVTMHDMHAWPELYFAGYGWVSFEPTPGVSTTNSPAPTPSATPSASSSPTNSPRTTPTTAATPTVSPARPVGLGGGLPVLLWALAGVGVAAVVLGTPAVLRARQRRSRLAHGRDPGVMALDALDELRATALDHGRPWPPGSPRFSAAAAAAWADDATTADGVRLLGEAAERARFGGPEHPAPAADWTPTASGFDRALGAASETRWAALRARLFPRSLVRRS